MQSRPELVGKWVACPICQQQFVLPGGQLSAPRTLATMHATTPTATGYRPSNPGDWLSGIKVPILISGILNAIYSAVSLLALVATCVGVILIPLVVPLIILCVFEIVYYGSADRLPPRKAINDGRTIAICEIVAGALTVNVFVLVCGILALVGCSQAEQRLAASTQ
jgi:hypothetical protein